MNRLARTRFLSVLFAVWAATATHAVDSASIDAVVQKAMEASKLPSLSVAVVHRGRLVYSRAFGYSNLEVKAKATRDTVYEIGSTTKQFTAALVLLQVEAGQMRLDESIRSYVENLPDAWQPITVRHCLTHTSGLKDYLATLFNVRKDYSHGEVVDLVAKQKLDFAPGEAWSYTNTGFYLLGMALEKVTGKKYSELLSEQIFRPLGMTKTRSLTTSDLVPNRASGYTVTDKKTTNAELLRETAAFSAGNILSTPTDMTKWSIAVQTGKLLSPESYREFLAPVRLNTGRTHPYAMGWFLHQGFSENMVEHGGNTYGQTCGHWIFLDSKVSVVALTNRQGADMGRLPYSIADLFDPKVIETSKAPSDDPDPELTKRLRDAFNLYLNNQLQPEYHSSEFIEASKTARHRIAISMAKSQLGQVLSLKYVDSQELPNSKLVRYSVRAEKPERRFGIVIEVSPDGKIVRAANDRLQ